MKFKEGVEGLYAVPTPKQKEPFEDLGPDEYHGQVFDLEALPEWTRGLQWVTRVGRSGSTISATHALQASTDNLIQILTKDPRWEGVVAWNEFQLRLVKTRPPPWGSTLATGSNDGAWCDEDDVRLAAWFARAYRMKVASKAASEVVAVAGEACRFHPVKQWLDGLVWDGVARCDHWLRECFGAPDDEITSAFGAKWLISGVARIYDPGCKVDTMLVLEGGQGVKKSTCLERLMPDEKWFLDLRGDLDSKDTLQNLRGKWIAEISELSSVRRSDNEATKRFLSCRSDTYRDSYGRRSKDHPRQGILAGSTNGGVNQAYLNDPTGGRRFWPVPCEKADDAWIVAHREQLWAEARERYMAHEPWWLSPELELSAARLQEDRQEVDSWSTDLLSWIATQPCVTISSCLSHLGIDVGNHDRGKQMRVGSILVKAKWFQRGRDTSGGQNIRTWYPPAR